MPSGVRVNSQQNDRPGLVARNRGYAIVVCTLGITLNAWPGFTEQTAARGRIMLAQVSPAKTPTIELAPVIIAEPGTETLLALKVGPSDDLPRNTFVRVRGLPARISLSDGHAISPGVWAVPLFAITNLRAIIPPGMQGRSELTLSLVDIDGGVVAEARSALIFAPAALVAPPPAAENLPLRTGTIAAAQAPAPQAAAEPTASVPITSTPAAPVSPLEVQAEPKPETKTAALPLAKDDAAAQPPRLEVVPAPRPAPSVSVLSPEALAQAQRLMALGKKQLGDGNISAARNYYARAADAGLAEGALRMAETYDPAVLASLNVRGVQPNPAEAQTWYEKARALGAKEADEPIKRLSAR